MRLPPGQTIPLTPYGTMRFPLPRRAVALIDTDRVDWAETQQPNT
jgi:hypothetical protein